VDAADVFRLVRNGEETVLDIKDPDQRGKLLEFAQQGRDYSEKMKEYNDRVNRARDAEIGRLVADGKLVTPGQSPPSQDQSGTGGVGQAPYQPTAYPQMTNIPAPQPQQNQYPRGQVQTDQFGWPLYPQQEMQQGQPQVVPDPRVDAIGQQMAQLHGVIEEMRATTDQVKVQRERDRFNQVVNRAKDKLPKMNESEVAWQILRNRNPDALTDEDIWGLCKMSSDSNQSRDDRVIADYLEAKNKNAGTKGPAVGQRGRTPKSPEKPLKDFSEAHAAALDFLQNSSSG